MMDPITITSILSIGGKIIDRLWPDPEKKAAARMELVRMAQEGELKELETRMSAILAEAKSADPWTSRARPSFLYVMYAMILFSIPMGILAVFSPHMGEAMASGMRAWLASIPDSLWGVFGIGYSGYSIARSIDKRNVQAMKGDS